MTVADSSANIPPHVPPELVRRFDFRHDPRIAADPWGFVGSLADAPDIFYAPDLGGYWVVTGNALVEETFRRHDLFSNRVVSIPEIPGAPPLIPNNFDPPLHGPYRKILAQKMFSPRALASLEADAREMTRARLDEIAPLGHCEFVDTFARRLPVDIFLRMMGLPLDRRDEFLPWVQGVFRPESVAQSAQAFGDLAKFLGNWLDERVADPSLAGGHMLPAMLEARLDGRPLSKDEMLSIWMMLFLGGLDTVTAQMTHIAHALATNPALRQRLAGDPALIRPALEELLRRYGIANIGRIVSNDVTYHGVAMKAGDLVLCSTPIAGMDAKTFPDPQTVDIERANAQSHCAFGSGIHVCPGAYLARLELRVMLEEMLPRLPNLRLGKGSVTASSGGTLSLSSLPIAWDPPSA